MRKNRFKKIIGDKGVVAGWITDKVIKIKLWKAIIILILMTIGTVWIVTCLLDSVERITKNRMNSGIVHGFRSHQGKFWINDTTSVVPDGEETGRIRIAGAGDEGIRKIEEGK